MAPIKTMLARRVARTTAKHTVRGAASKLRRDPVRSGALLAIGCAVGLLAGWLLARSGSPSARAQVG